MSRAPVPKELEALVQPHIESFDYFVGEGLHKVVEGIEPIEVRSKSDGMTFGQVRLLARLRGRLERGGGECARCGVVADRGAPAQ